MIALEQALQSDQSHFKSLKRIHEIKTYQHKNVTDQEDSDADSDGSDIFLPDIIPKDFKTEKQYDKIMHTFSGLEFQKDDVCKEIRISEMELQNLQENIREIKATLSTDNEMDKESKIMEIKALESIIHKTENAISVKRKELANIDILIAKENRTKKTFHRSKQEETRSVQKVRRGKGADAKDLTKGHEETSEVEKTKEKDNNLKRMEAEKRANIYLKMRHEKLELMKRERIKEIDKRRENKLKVELIMNKAKAKMSKKLKESLEKEKEFEQRLIDEFNKQEVSRLNLDDFINISKSRRKKEREMRREKEEREEKLNEIATRVFGIASKVKLKSETENHFNEDKTVNKEKNVEEDKNVKEIKNVKKEIGDGDAEEKYDDKDVSTKIKPAPVLGPAPLMYCRIEHTKNKSENETLTFMPRQLIINEYEKETRVNKMISITNSSKESIVLKAIRVPLEVSDLLNIECNFPMTLHPGFSTKISLTFLNSEEEEISTRIILMAEYFSNKANLASEFQQHAFLISVKPKKVSFDFPKQINVGEVYLGNIKEFCINNLKDVDMDKLKEFDLNVLMKSLKFTIPETNKTLITPLNDFQFSLAAKELGHFKDKILITSVAKKFEGNEIEVCGDCVPFDVAIENSKLDFGICHSKQDVTREFVIRNNSLKMVNFNILPLKNDAISRFEFFPFNGMIQPKGSLAVKVKHKVRFEKHKVDNLNSKFDFMAKILFPNCYPAEMIINLCGCTTEIKINHEPRIIDFGVLDSRENVKSLLKLNNPSLLDLEISLKSLPSQVWSPLIKENVKIDSNSSIEIPFYFKEKKEGKFKGFISLSLMLKKDETNDTDLDQSELSLKLKSETNVKIPLKATIVDAPIKFNKNLNFGIISHHVLKEDTILMQNTFSDECDFVFASPDSQNIKITIFPTNGKLFKGQTKAVYISASLLLNEQPLKLYEGHDIEMPNMELAQKPLQNEDAIPDLNLKRHTKSHRRSSVMERRQSVSLRKESDNGGDKQLENLKVENNTENLSSSNIKLTIPCYLDFIDQVGERQTSCFPVHVSFKIQNPSFKLSFSKNPIKNNVLDFGVIPCSTRIVESLTIENLSNDPQTLGVVPLNPLGPFEIVNANRTIPPLSKLSLKISYFPCTMTRDLDELFLQINQDENIRLYLTGAAIQGSYQIEVDNNLVSFGDVAVSDTVEKQINIRNTCNAFLKGTFSIINVQIKSKENEKEKKEKDKEKKENLEDQSSNENGSSLNVTTFSLEAKSFEIEPNSLKPFIIKMTSNQDKCEYEADLEIKIDGCQSSVVKLKGKSSKKDKAKHK